ncbi:MAG: NUDIX domain-containing protein [Candidatus Sungbacteria bacterium]|uniref:NUDIX domain-containing protein n=1 Tax=Candidatus Sungiibacteriota bacterium TaxID=2750080 RepID=A0A931WNY7_9BACT|nr:NUDIX domain-containing protein [Candidatus Sungbacteria bacterium]
MASERDLYYVAVKVFLEDKGRLFIFKDRYGGWDLPGGRIQRHEFRVLLESVIKRKMKEELGSAVRYRLGKPEIFMRHERREASLKRNVRIFAIGYPVLYTGGAIRLSREHTEYQWVPIAKLKPAKYFRGGWLEGVREYLRNRK